MLLNNQQVTGTVTVKEENPEFRKIKSLYCLYEINNNGTIMRNVKSKKHIKIKLDYHHSQTGYYMAFVHLGGRKNSKTIRVMIAHAVAECWLGPRPEGYEVDHIDRNSHNNDYRNLRYVTKSEQMKNRDHSNISKIGTNNLKRHVQSVSKSVVLVKDKQELCFDSYAAAARYLAGIYPSSFDSIRTRFSDRRSHIFEYDIRYLRNAETASNHLKG